MAGTRIQERFTALEVEARERISRALTQSNTRLKELDRALGRVTRDDWSVPGMRRHVEAWRARAESLRDAAVKRARQMPGEAVSALASGTRVPLRTLSRQLGEIAKRIEPERNAEAGFEAEAPRKAPAKVEVV
jgi:hypothetical protein